MIYPHLSGFLARLFFEGTESAFLYIFRKRKHSLSRERLIWFLNQIKKNTHGIILTTRLEYIEPNCHSHNKNSFQILPLQLPCSRGSFTKKLQILNFYFLYTTKEIIVKLKFSHPPRNYKINNRQSYALSSFILCLRRESSHDY